MLLDLELAVLVDLNLSSRELFNTLSTSSVLTDSISTRYSDDYKFFPPRLIELQEKEQLWLRVSCFRLRTFCLRRLTYPFSLLQKQREEKAVLGKPTEGVTAEQLEEERVAEQAAIDTGECYATSSTPSR